MRLKFAFPSQLFIDASNFMNLALILRKNNLPGTDLGKKNLAAENPKTLIVNLIMKFI